jgi:acetolactate synthase-1/2/3 large subunit
MRRTGAWLVVYALEQLGVRHSFGIPGVHNTELYDALAQSPRITPILVTHEGGGAFMADAVSRVSDMIGTLVTVPAAGLTHAASGIGEAFLDGVPMLVLSGGVRQDGRHRYQVHEMDLHAFMRGLTKATFKLARHDEIVPTLYRAYDIAVSGEPGPVYVEIPMDLQMSAAEIEPPSAYARPPATAPAIDGDRLRQAAALLAAAEHPGLFLGWGARDCTETTRALAEHLQAPVATTLQGLSVFSADHPLHAGFGFGPAAVPASRNAFAACDCLLAVGTRFSEIATGSFGTRVPETLIHLDINPAVFNANYPARLTLEGDARQLLPPLLAELKRAVPESRGERGIAARIAQDKAAYRQSWYASDREAKVNPARFFDALRRQAPDDAITVLDDGNHTYLAAELFPVRAPRSLIVPTDFNAMGYAVPAAIGAKLALPAREVNAIIGDGAFAMTCMEILTASRNALGIVFYVFHDGELSQISQIQSLPYNRKTCSVIGDFDLAGIAAATGAGYVAMPDNAAIAEAIAEAASLAALGQPVIVDIAIDYAKRTAFTEGIGRAAFGRMPLGQKARMVTRALMRRLVP